MLAVILLHTTLKASDSIKKEIIPMRVFTMTLFMMITVNSLSVFSMNLKMLDYSKPRIEIVSTVEDLIKKHSAEQDFSFSVAQECMDSVKWLRKTGDPPEKRYTFAEVLFPKYYVDSGGKYKVSKCGKFKTETSNLNREST